MLFSNPITIYEGVVVHRKDEFQAKDIKTLEPNEKIFKVVDACSQLRLKSGTSYDVYAEFTLSTLSASTFTSKSVFAVDDFEQERVRSENKAQFENAEEHDRVVTGFLNPDDDNLEEDKSPSSSRRLRRKARTYRTSRCSSAHEEFAKVGAASMQVVIDDALSELPGGIAYKKKKFEDLERWFNKNSQVTGRGKSDLTIARQFKRLRTYYMRKRFKMVCDSACGDDTYAYVYPGDRLKRIYLCGAFWQTPSDPFQDDSRALTLIHELSHFSNVAKTDDYAYGRRACMRLATSDPSKARANADNWGYFAQTPYNTNKCGIYTTIEECRHVYSRVLCEWKNNICVKRADFN